MKEIIFVGNTIMELNQIAEKLAENSIPFSVRIVPCFDGAIAREILVRRKHVEAAKRALSMAAIA